MYTAQFVLALNICIVLAVSGITWLTGNPLAILGLFFMQPIPQMQITPQMLYGGDDDEEEDDGGKIGFTADV
jgi:hypothetical protein